MGEVQISQLIIISKKIWCSYNWFHSILSLILSVSHPLRIKTTFGEDLQDLAGGMVTDNNQLVLEFDKTIMLLNETVHVFDANQGLYLCDI